MVDLRIQPGNRFRVGALPTTWTYAHEHALQGQVVTVEAHHGASMVIVVTDDGGRFYMWKDYLEDV